MTQKKPKVLLVDDEPHVTRGLQAAFRRQPFDVLVADSAKEAISVLAREQIDVLITDEMMPGMHGSELLLHAREHSPATVRIVLTGQASMESAIRAINEGRAFRFLTKPFSPVQLADVIGEALASRSAGAVKPKPSEEARMITALEDRYPGLTQVERESDGGIAVEEGEADVDVASVLDHYR
jgi:two-component system probable response regulator PhcQ